MRIAISNLAWDPQQDPKISEILREEGIQEIELAPTKLWSDLTDVLDSAILDYRRYWSKKGIRIVALQSLLFGRPDLLLFGSTSQRKQLLAYLERVMDIASLLGARPLVFGSPKNRLRGDLKVETALEMAVEFFSKAGQKAAERGVILCLEPNPPSYGCDFMNDSVEALRLVQMVQSPGIALHLDTGCAQLCGEDLCAQLPHCLPYLRHFHFSRENLLPVGDKPNSRDSAILRQLAKGSYSGSVSIEMKASGSEVDDRLAIRKALQYLTELAGHETLGT